MNSHGRRRAFPQFVQRSFAFALVLATCMAPLRSATLARLSLDDMILESTAIVRGKVTASYAAFQGPVIYTHYTIQVTEGFKGTAGGSIDVVVPGGVANNVRQWFAGTPQLQTGGDFVFFLWTVKSGLTQIIGLTQGLFAVSSADQTNPVATRAASKELMLDPTTGRQVKDQTLVFSLSDLRSQIASTLKGSAK